MKRHSVYFYGSHALVVTTGAFIILLAHRTASALLGLVPGYAERVSEWLTTNPQRPAPMIVVLSVVVAAILSLVQEAPRTRGLSWSIRLGVLSGLVGLVSRAFSTPGHLYDVAALVVAIRTAGVIVAAVVMYNAKRAWFSRENAAAATAG